VSAVWLLWHWLLLSTWVVAASAEFDQYLPVEAPVLMLSVTLLQDCIANYLPPPVAGNVAHFIAVHHY